MKLTVKLKKKSGVLMFLSLLPSRRRALYFRVSAFVRMYVVVALKILVEK